MTTTHQSSFPQQRAEAPYDELAAQLHGRLVRPADADYDSVRAVYNAMIDQRPAAIARCRNAVDVSLCVKFARRHGLEASVRGGGHNAAGLGVRDGALTIDLSEMRSVQVDPQARTVRVEGGCTWSDVDHATGGFGLATPCGFLAGTGVGGLALGGGVGYLSRRYGLTVDNLLEADVVLADGTQVRASEDENPDLFWALRGGGGNFGVVTSFLFRSHPVGEDGIVIAGPIFYDLADLGSVMRWYRELLPSLPEEISGWLGILTIPPVAPFPEDLWLHKACVINWCYTGPHDRAEEVLAPIKEFGDPLIVAMQEMPFPAFQSMFDPLLPPGLQWYWKADNFTEISDRAITVHEKYAAEMPVGLSTMHLYPIDGAAARVPDDATPFAYRSGGWAGVIVGVDADPANREQISDWARRYWEELHPTSAGGGYVNFLGEEGEDRVRAAYLGNYARLTRVKSVYDPDNFFHVNQNIKPA